MENTENTLVAENEITPENRSLVIDSSIEPYLMEITKWGSFISIVGFVFTGLMALLGLFFLIAGSQFNQFGGFAGVIYIIMAIIYFFPVYYLFNASKNIKKALKNKDQHTLIDGFDFLKSHYKYTGILLIVMISIYVIFIGFGLLTALMYH